MNKGWIPILAGLALIATSGCVRRTLVITTEPPNALVYLNDEEVGRSEVRVDFTWYGDYDVIIRKEGYETLKTNWQVQPPWYQQIPIDFFVEVLWPGTLHDVHEQHFVLEPAVLPSREELAERTIEMRQKTLNAQD